ncbi:MAG TPA: lysylphosphatidylglycerol synthase domain-containing protein, partial [Acidimicrobiales bacterium]
MADARRWWRAAQFPIGVVLAGVALYVVFGKRDEIEGASAYLDHLRLYWVAVAVLAEGVALFAFAGLQRRLLASGRLPVGYGPLLAVTYAGNAIANSLPGGPAWGSVYAYRQFRRLGADETLAAWTLVAVSVCSGAGLALVAAAGLAVAGLDQGADLNLVIVIVGALVVIVGGAALLRRRATVERPAVRLVQLVQRVFHRPAGDPAVVVADLLSRLTRISPSRGEWTEAMGWATANWLWDSGCLALCFAAV